MPPDLDRPSPRGAAASAAATAPAPVDPTDVRPPAVFHVDLDGGRHIYATRGWTWRWRDDPLFRTGMENLLAFLDRNGVRATLFTIAGDLDDPEKRPWLEEAVRRGHEIASHSVTHPDLLGLGREAKRREIEESRRRLEDELGVGVAGFRAPSYTIDREGLELLEETGYRYDSSVYPDAQFRRRLGVSDLPDRPHRPLPGGDLLELPLPAHRPAPFPFHPCYSLILGVPYFRWGLRSHRKTRRPLVLLFHLTDFASPLEAERLPGLRAKVFTLSHLAARTKEMRCQAMMDLVQANYRVTDTAGLVGESSQKTTASDPVVLAISTTHETGSAIFEGAELRAAMSEERLDRVKFSTAYPPHRSIDQCIRVAGIAPDRITDVVISGLPPRRLLPRMAKGQARDCFEFHALNDYVPHFCKVLYRSFYFYRALRYGAVKRYLRRRYRIRPRVHFVDHHLCHAAAAYRTAPFDDALIITADGVGDDLSLTVSTGRSGRIERLAEVPYPHSFGQFYTACTQALGFRGGRHEGKITGLSGYGTLDPALVRKVQATIRRSGPEFRLDKRYYSEGFVRGFSLKKWRKGESLFDVLQYRNYKKPLARLLAGHDREQVAAVFQRLLEDEMEELVRPFVRRTGLRNLCLCGGVFANVKLNSTLFRSLGLDNVYIFPHMGDGGLSVGAALEFLQAQPRPFETVYWGPEYTEAELEPALRAAREQGLRYERHDDIESVIARLLAEKNVVARFNGRMEFGPRALGNRSILYSASDPGANKWLNKRLRRTEFMPFAPVAMAEHADKLFENRSGTEHACKFMTIILPCTEWTKEHCPAIVHVDGTARPQLVTRQSNESMYRILEEYEAITGIPLVVNTSFNMHEEPIVCTPSDAVRAYLDSRLDYLAMGPFLAWIEGNEKSSESSGGGDDD